MDTKSYPSKNRIRLLAEVERLSGGRVDFTEEENGLRLEISYLGHPDREWSVRCPIAGVADRDAAERQLLVMARRELIHGR